MRRLGIYIRAGQVYIGLDCDRFYCYLSYKLSLLALAAFREACWGYPKRRVWAGQGWYKGRSGSGIMDWDWLVES